MPEQILYQLFIYVVLGLIFLVNLYILCLVILSLVILNNSHAILTANNNLHIDFNLFKELAHFFFMAIIIVKIPQFCDRCIDATIILINIAHAYILTNY